MKYILTAITILSIVSTTEASSIRRRRATEGFMGAPARKAHQHHSKKEIAADIAGGLATGVGQEAIKELKKSRSGDKSSY